jgi:hypothetical protein
MLLGRQTLPLCSAEAMNLKPNRQLDLPPATPLASQTCHTWLDSRDIVPLTMRNLV